MVGPLLDVGSAVPLLVALLDDLVEDDPEGLPPGGAAVELQPTSTIPAATTVDAPTSAASRDGLDEWPRVLARIVSRFSL
jgi:hypothetical protein